MMAIDLAALARFWGFVVERQRVWHRRFIYRQRPPWTEDPHLSAGHFTNVYRELDPGTRFATEILTRSAPLEERVLNLMVYRLIGREETMKRLGWITLPFKPHWFRENLERQRVDGPIFGSAYMVNSYSAMGWGDKILNVTALLRNLTEERWPVFWGRFLRTSGVDGYGNGDRRELHATLSQEYGWGRFLAFQVMVDLAYPLPDPTNLAQEAQLPTSMGNHGGWATAGPGTLRGLQRIWPAATQKGDDGLLAFLESSPEALDGLSAIHMHPAPAAPAWTDPYGLWLASRARGGQLFPLRLSRANIANCLCEWDKYEKAREGAARVIRPFNPRRSWHADLEARGHGAQLEMLK